MGKKGGRYGKYGEVKRFERLRQKKRSLQEVPKDTRKNRREFPKPR